MPLAHQATAAGQQDEYDTKVAGYLATKSIITDIIVYNATHHYPDSKNITREWMADYIWGVAFDLSKATQSRKHVHFSMTVNEYNRKNRVAEFSNKFQFEGDENNILDIVTRFDRDWVIIKKRNWNRNDQEEVEVEFEILNVYEMPTREEDIDKKKRK